MLKATSADPSATHPRVNEALALCRLKGCHLGVTEVDGQPGDFLEECPGRLPSIVVQFPGMLDARQR